MGRGPSYRSSNHDCAESVQPVLPHNMSVVATLTNSESVAVYKHVLIATDGSELAGKAVAVGLELAKSLNARTTAVNVTEPWSVTVTGDPVLMYPTIGYEKAAAESAANVLSTVRDAAREWLSGGIHRRDGTGQGVRSDRHGVARAARSIQAVARESNDQSVGAYRDAGACLPVSERPLTAALVATYGAAGTRHRDCTAS
jgi:nucleotide-binding universal stress UspA family protein